MDIKFKQVRHERDLDAPFVGALICADGCHFKCKGCFNKQLKKEPTLISSAKKIIDEVKANPFNDGVIFAGLEWSEQPLELLAVCEEADKRGLQIMIYTGCSLNEFQERIGKACVEQTGFDKDFTKKLLIEDDKTFYQMIGVVMLDKAIKSSYYIKTGRYDSEKKVDNYEVFGVYLSSSNQMIYKIKGEDEDESEVD